MNEQKHLAAEVSLVALQNLNQFVYLRCAWLEQPENPHIVFGCGSLVDCVVVAYGVAEPGHLRRLFFVHCLTDDRSRYVDGITTPPTECAYAPGSTFLVDPLSIAKGKAATWPTFAAVTSGDERVIGREMADAREYWSNWHRARGGLLKELPHRMPLVISPPKKPTWFQRLTGAV